MHRSSYQRMQAFRDAYLAEARNLRLKILDVGSASIDGVGTYRDLFATDNWEYFGLDTQPAPNVDIAVSDPYHWRELREASFDVVISGQAFEHIEWPWLTIMEIARVLRPAGFAAITAPSSGHVHRHPTDCWRYYPDGFPALSKFGGLTLLENDVDFSFVFRKVCNPGGTRLRSCKSLCNRLLMRTSGAKEEPERFVRRAESTTSPTSWSSFLWRPLRRKQCHSMR